MLLQQHVGTSEALRGPHRPGSPERRRHTRISVRLPVRCKRLTPRASRAWHGRTADVGGGGFAVELPTRLAPGTTLTVKVQTGIGPLWTEAEVVWTRRVTGRIGITCHGLCLSGRSEILDLPVGVLLGQWLQGVARREREGAGSPTQNRKQRKDR